VERRKKTEKKGIRMCEGIINHHSFSLIVPARPTFSPSRKSQKYKETQRTIALKQKFEKK
jgi:ribosomal protein S6E (S10)